MSRTKHSPELKIMVVQKYLAGEGSLEALSKAYGVGYTSLRRWLSLFRAQGKAGFYRGVGNTSYSKEFKLSCVAAALRGEDSIIDIVAKYNISNESVLRHWIACYNANMELKDYEPKREVYMAEARRKTTLEERKEIVLPYRLCEFWISVKDAMIGKMFTICFRRFHFQYIPL